MFEPNHSFRTEVMQVLSVFDRGSSALKLARGIAEENNPEYDHPKDSYYLQRQRGPERPKQYKEYNALQSDFGAGNRHMTMTGTNQLLIKVVTVRLVPLFSAEYASQQRNSSIEQKVRVQRKEREE